MKQFFTLISLAFYFLPVRLDAQVLEMAPDQISQVRIKSAIISAIQTDAESEPVKREAYTFDRAGYLVGRVTYKADDTPGTSAIFRYDAQGNRTFHEITIHPEHITPNVSYHYLYENGRIVKEENNNTSLTRHFFYDEYGRTIREEYRDGRDHVAEAVTYSYDDEGNLITETSDQEFIKRRTTYQYDEAGNLIEKKKISDYSFEAARSTYSCERYVYDVEGKMMHSMRLDAAGKILGSLNFTYDDKGRLSTKSSGKVIYRYAYDDKGMLSSRRKLVAGKVREEISYEYRYYEPLQESKVASQK